MARKGGGGREVARKGEGGIVLRMRRIRKNRRRRSRKKSTEKRGRKMISCSVMRRDK